MKNLILLTLAAWVPTGATAADFYVSPAVAEPSTLQHVQNPPKVDRRITVSINAPKNKDGVPICEAKECYLLTIDDGEGRDLLSINQNGEIEIDGKIVSHNKHTANRVLNGMRVLSPGFQPACFPNDSEKSKENSHDAIR